MSVSIESCSHASSGVVNWVHTICLFSSNLWNFLPLYSAIIILPELFRKVSTFNQRGLYELNSWHCAVEFYHHSQLTWSHTLISIHSSTVLKIMDAQIDIHSQTLVPWLFDNPDINPSATDLYVTDIYGDLRSKDFYRLGTQVKFDSSSGISLTATWG